MDCVIFLTFFDEFNTWSIVRRSMTPSTLWPVIADSIDGCRFQPEFSVSHSEFFRLVMESAPERGVIRVATDLRAIQVREEGMK
jgi:hypothetical protein